MEFQMEEEARWEEDFDVLPEPEPVRPAGPPAHPADRGAEECRALYEQARAILGALEAERAARAEAEERRRRLEEECRRLGEDLAALREERERWAKPVDLIFRMLLRAAEAEVALERRLEEEVHARLRRLAEDGILRALVGEEFFRHLVAGGPAGPEKWEEWVAAIVRRVVQECDLKVVRVEGV
ncbi:MAG: hypothetical protein ACUVTQ_08180 [Desulfotomaculales bacterium]